MTTLGRLVEALLDFDIHPTFLDLDIEQAEVRRVLLDAHEEVLAELRHMTLAQLSDVIEQLPEYWRWDFKHRQLDLAESTAKAELAFEVLRARAGAAYGNLVRWIETGKSDSKVVRSHPELANLRDEDGLFPLGAPLSPDSHGVAYKRSNLYYHQFLRRCFIGNINYDFVDALLRISSSNPSISARIALDPYRLAPRGARRQIFEKDAWFGPPFSWARLDDMNAVGLTVHEHPTVSRLSPYGIQRTEFLWARDDEAIKSFQAEELPALELAREPYVICRYVHSQRDTKRQSFVHLDGAVRIYRREDLPQRFDQTLAEAAPVKYMKLFRVDGDLSSSSWSTLVSYYFRQNELVLEYLNLASM